MSKKELDTKLSKMSIVLNSIIEKNGYNLQNDEVLMYSQEIDKIIEEYVRGYEERNTNVSTFKNSNLAGLRVYDEFF